jgi:hypothetical protein
MTAWCQSIRWDFGAPVILAKTIRSLFSRMSIVKPGMVSRSRPRGKPCVGVGLDFLITLAGDPLPPPGGLLDFQAHDRRLEHHPNYRLLRRGRLGQARAAGDHPPAVLERPGRQLILVPPRW